MATRHGVENDWPDHVETIGIDRLDYLGVDAQGRLYWKGNPVEVRNGLQLSLWQRVGAVLIAISAVVGAASAALSSYADLAGETKTRRYSMANAGGGEVVRLDTWTGETKLFTETELRGVRVEDIDWDQFPKAESQ